jgi:hypothetical protein
MGQLLITSIFVHTIHNKNVSKKWLKFFLLSLQNHINCTMQVYIPVQILGFGYTVHVITQFQTMPHFRPSALLPCVCKGLGIPEPARPSAVSTFHESPLWL